MRCMLPGPQLPAHTASEPGQMGLGAGGEGRDLFVTNAGPFDPVALAEGLREAVE